MLILKRFQSTHPCHEWSSTGRIPSIKTGRRVLFDLHDIDNVMSKSKRPCNRSDTVANKIIGDIQGDES
jgi:hypothetical protein